jgi:hypothetical protein
MANAWGNILSPAAAGSSLGVPGAIGGAAFGLGAYLFDKNSADKKNAILAMRQQMAPYTHVQPTDELATANPLGEITQGAATGAAIGTGIDREAAASAKDAAMTKFYDQGGPMSASNYWSVPSFADSFDDSVNASPTENTYSLRNSRSSYPGSNWSLMKGRY